MWMVGIFLSTTVLVILRLVFRWQCQPCRNRWRGQCYPYAVAWWLVFAEIAVSKQLHNQSVLVIGLAMLVLFLHGNAGAISLDDIQLWSGSGTNRSALVIEWNSPELLNQTSVAAPVA